MQMAAELVAAELVGGVAHYLMVALQLLAA